VSGLPVLKFDEENHIYSYDDRRIPSVTQCLDLGGITDKRWYTQTARDRGSAVHKAAAMYDDGELDEATVDSMYVAPYLGAYKAFLSDNKVDHLLIEKQFYYDEYEYAGTFDRLSLVNDRLYVIDFKTGNVEPWARLQLTAYQLYVRSIGFKRAKRMCVQLKNNGMYRVHTWGNEIEDETAWRACLYMAKWRIHNEGIHKY